ncbi:hypothetical protein GCM10007036_10070 [Alsobacter metallidurans]|uniref:Uncharacterized protein n=1 Tax=Alsobacter metallidurans TaxID=340221 RepID=A0A917I578_9HYPH|nr:hypothetical protein GCM10007036_10070 [Alsobacter metallidurans]
MEGRGTLSRGAGEGREGADGRWGGVVRAAPWRTAASSVACGDISPLRGREVAHRSAAAAVAGALTPALSPWGERGAVAARSTDWRSSPRPALALGRVGRVSAPPRPQVSD